MSGDRRYHDLEAGDTSRRDYEEDTDGGPFDIVRTKRAPINRLKRWRQAALVLNASCRFRYTLDLKKEEAEKQLAAKIRTHAQVIRAAVLFQASGQGISGDFGLSAEELVSMSKDHDISPLQQTGGVKGVAEISKFEYHRKVNIL